jgi:hypothetical protein
MVSLEVTAFYPQPQSGQSSGFVKLASDTSLVSGVLSSSGSAEYQACWLIRNGFIRIRLNLSQTGRPKIERLFHFVNCV